MSLKGKKIGILAGTGYEDLELHYPHLRLTEEGAEVEIIAVKKETVKGKRGLSVEADLALKDVRPEDYDCLVIPGGWAPDRLRRYCEVLDFVREIHEAGKIRAAICHSPQILIARARALAGQSNRNQARLKVSIRIPIQHFYMFSR